eukprot:scaffold227990_cov15-Tisochrysis_lutea.AAC.1
MPSCAPSLKVFTGRGDQLAYTTRHAPSRIPFLNPTLPTINTSKHIMFTKNGGSRMTQNHTPGLRSLKEGPKLHPGYCFSTSPIFLTPITMLKPCVFINEWK